MLLKYHARVLCSDKLVPVRVKQKSWLYFVCLIY